MHGGSQYSHRNLAGSGWEVSAITTFATGHPFDISYQGGESYSLFCSNGDFYYTCPDVPNQVAPVRFANPHNTQAATRGQLFDGTTNQFQLGAANILGASFADEATGTFGNISRNQYFGPGDNTNMTVAQNISFSKDNPNRFIQLRIEAYNGFNHTNFANPTAILTTTGQKGAPQSAPDISVWSSHPLSKFTCHRHSEQVSGI